MDKLKKVLKGLQCCNTWSCAGLYEGYQPDYDACIECPFRCDPIDPEECHKKLLDSALSLLKEQEPRVMTLEEARKDIEIWYESINGACGYGDLCYDSKADLALYTPHGIKGVEESAYNKTWRCWTSRPTDKQRKAKPWTS